MPNVRSRGFCFTLNNPTGWDESFFDYLVANAQYVIRGIETGQSGTPHWQGYVYFKDKKSFDQVRDLIPGAHIEKQRGTFDQAIDYCKKDGNFQEWGDRPSGPSGQKNQWKEVLRLAKSGQLEEIENRYPAIFIRYHSKLCSLYKPEHPIILQVLQNEWWVGATGTGKSRTLWDQHPLHFQKPLNKWWDGYAGEEVVAIEEWAPKNEVTASFLKIWADRYPFTAEIKGGTLTRIRPKKIIVLSNYTPEQCFSNEEDLLPIKRRFKIVHFASI